MELMILLKNLLLVKKLLFLLNRALESAKLINENKLLMKIADPDTPLIGNSSFIN